MKDYCTTHFHACDCREEMHREEIEKLKADLKDKDGRIRKLSGCVAHYIEADDMVAKDSCDKNSIRLLNELSQETDNE